MAYEPKFNFSAGELTPQLHERTNLDKYQTGLKTERGAMTSKVGTILGKPGSSLVIRPKFDNQKSIFYEVPYTKYIVEIGHLYIRTHDMSAGTYVERTSPYPEERQPYMQFSAYKNQYVYISAGGGYPLRRLDLFEMLGIGGLDAFPGEPPIEISLGEIAGTSFGAPSGIQQEYIATYIRNGEESSPPTTYSILMNLPITTSQRNEIVVSLNRNDNEIDEYTEIYVYRRPRQASVYGFIGASNSYTDTPGPGPGTTTRAFKLVDFGQDAQFDHSPPATQFDFEVDNRKVIPAPYNPNGAIVYQDRLAMIGELSTDRFFLSRTSYHNNMTRDFPLDSDSALAIKPASNGNLKIFRLADLGGLAALSTQGIYMNPPGPLVPETAFATKVGTWVIDEFMPPLEVPGGFLIVDKSTNSVVLINYSDERQGFIGSEVSIFSNHLFKGKRLVSWAFQEGDTPLVWIVFSDGSLGTFTYQNEQLMRAWAHSDDSGFYEGVISHRDESGATTVYFWVLRNGKRMLESLAPFWIETMDIKDYIGMVSTKSYSTNLADGGVTFTVTPVTPGEWDGPLTLVASGSVFTDTPNDGTEGTIYRYFSPDKSSTDLEVVTYVNNTTVIVQPLPEFPSAEANFSNLYKTFDTFAGLDHIEGYQVAVMVDGFVDASPLNVQDNLNTYTVDGGEITLANGERGAIVHIGLPFATDIETLDVDTVEQKPTLLESINAKRMNIKVFQSLGFWVGNKFPANNTNEGMYNPLREGDNESDDNTNTVPPQPRTERFSFDIDGDWKSQGRICIRKVDPVPFELLSLIPDLEIHWR